MSDTADITKYDDVLSSILEKENSVLGFLSAIFNFLGRRTDFYYVPEGSYENMGFPPGVAEKIVIKVLRNCDPKNWESPNDAPKPADLNNEIMCSTVAQEVEVIADEDGGDVESPINENSSDIPLASSVTLESKETVETKEVDKDIPKAPQEDYTPPVIPLQKNSETYNGAERETYSWSQTITEIDVTMKLPSDIKSAKDLKVTLNAGDICVARRNGDIIKKDSLPYKIKAIDSFWSISEGRLLMHLEKVQDRWWSKFLDEEEPIDLSKIDCSRPLHELPQDHIDKVMELQWNQEQKLKGLPTSDDIRNIEVLKKAWNAAGSPFKGQEFDPSVLSQSSQVHSFLSKQ